MISGALYHLVTTCEMMMVDGEMVDDEMVDEMVDCEMRW